MRSFSLRALVAITAGFVFASSVEAADSTEKGKTAS